MNPRPIAAATALFLASCAGESAALKAERERVLAEERAASEEIAKIEAATRAAAGEIEALRRDKGEAEAAARSLEAEIADAAAVAEVFRAARRDIEALGDEEDALLELLDELRALRGDPEELRRRSESLQAEAAWNLLAALARSARPLEFAEAAGLRPSPRLAEALEGFEELRDEDALLHPRPTRDELREFALAAAQSSLAIETAAEDIVFDRAASKTLQALSEAAAAHARLARFLAGDPISGEEPAPEGGDLPEEEEPAEDFGDASAPTNAVSALQGGDAELTGGEGGVETSPRRESLGDIWTSPEPLAPRLAPLWWSRTPPSRSEASVASAIRDADRMLAALRLLAELEEIRRADWSPEAHIQRRLTNIRLVRERIRASLDALAADALSAGGVR
ncbi:MAG: hypothetical protein ACUVYA_14385 [Planctomycetota bacterium]